MPEGGESRLAPEGGESESRLVRTPMQEWDVSEESRLVRTPNPGQIFRGLWDMAYLLRFAIRVRKGPCGRSGYGKKELQEGAKVGLFCQEHSNTVTERVQWHVRSSSVDLGTLMSKHRHATVRDP